MLGTGTSGDPYIIEDIYDLQDISCDLTAYYELGNDIDASTTYTWNPSSAGSTWYMGFKGLGHSYDQAVSIHLDGKEHTISNLHMQQPKSSQFAVSTGSTMFFAVINYLENGTIKNINFDRSHLVYADKTLDSNEFAGAPYPSVVFGYLSTNSLISNVKVLYPEIENLVDVTAIAGVSLFVSFNSGDSTIEKSGVHLNQIKYVEWIPGFVSYTSSNVASNITDCYVQGNYNLPSSHPWSSAISISGFAKATLLNDKTRFERCYSAISIDTNISTGGVGQGYWSAFSKISTGILTMDKSSVYSSMSNVFTDCYYDMDITCFKQSSWNTSSFITGYTTTQMKSSTNFPNYPSSIWGWSSDINDDYPHLKDSIYAPPTLATTST